jgi:hypothetical protein
MNCKPGDLAIIARVHTYRPQPQWIGRTVVVSQPRTNMLGETAWFYEGPLLPCNDGRGPATVLPDCILRPIRPQSDDATDEMVLRCGKPTDTHSDTVSDRELVTVETP